jgi:hypothetical protein
MYETQVCRVKRLPVKVQTIEQPALFLAGDPIKWIPQQRVTDRRHVHTHLMRPSGLQPAFDERSAVQRLDRIIMGDGSLAALNDRHLLAIGRATAKRRIDRALGGAEPSSGDRPVASIDRVLGELRGEAGMRPVRLGGHHQPRRILVDPMDDARPLHPANAREGTPAMMKQRVDESAIQIAAGRMNHQAGRLVDDNQMFVLEGDDERNVLCFVMRRPRIGRQPSLSLPGRGLLHHLW